MNNKTKNVISISLILCLVISFLLVSNSLLKLSVASAEPHFLDVSISPSTAKLSVNESQSFTAKVANQSSSPLSYSWYARGVSNVTKVKVNDAEFTLSSEPMHVADGETLSFSFVEATQNVVSLTVQANDTHFLGYADALIYDPYSSLGIYMDALPSMANYIVEADGSGWFRAISKIGQATSSTNDDDILQYAINQTTTAGGMVFVRAGAYSATVTVKNNVCFVLDYGVSGVTYSINAGATCTIVDYAGKVAKAYNAGTLESTFDFSTGSVTLAQWMNSTSASITNYYLNGQQLGFVTPTSFTIGYNSTSGMYQSWYGANGTLAWQSTNASAVINAALGNLTSGRTWKEKVVLKGNFTLNYVTGSGCITVPSYTILDLTNAILTLGNNANTTMIWASWATDIDIIGGVLKGNKANQAVQTNAIGLYQSSRIKVQGNSFSDFKGIGILMYGAGYSNDNFIKDNVFTDMVDYDAIALDDTGNERITVEGNHFVNSATPATSTRSIFINGPTKCTVKNNFILGAYYGIELDYAHHSIVEGNIIKGTVGFGVHLSGSTTNPITGVLVEGNVASNITGSSNNLGIVADNAVFSAFVNNICFSNGGGLNFESETFAVGIGNRMVGNIVFLNTGVGIVMTKQHGGIVDSNIVYNNNQSSVATWDSGIMMVSSEYCNVHDNYVTDNQTVKTQQYGIKERTDSTVPDYNNYFDNYLDGNAVGAFLLLGTHNKFGNNVGYVTENSVTATNTTATTCVFNHGLAGTPTNVQCSFNFTGWTSWTWTATSTQVTVTVTGTLPASWTVYAKVEYQP